MCHRKVLTKALTLSISRSVLPTQEGAHSRRKLYRFWLIALGAQLLKPLRFRNLNVFHSGKHEVIILAFEVRVFEWLDDLAGP